MPRVPILSVLLVLIGLTPLAAAPLSMGDKVVLRPANNLQPLVRKPAQMTILRPAQHKRPLAGAPVLSPVANTVRKQ